jgi:catechol 2,3-dioxygenase-like lactoylglutathione lyase family enzyme
MDYKLEVVAVPVSDVDAAKAFYERIGYHTDHDHRVNDNLRFVQITPPRLGVLDRDWRWCHLGGAGVGPANAGRR